MNNEFKKKYLKYKLKYNKLKQMGGYVFNWPNDWYDIAGLVANGKKIVEIKSMMVNKRTIEKLGFDQTIPGLTGVIEIVDKNNLIIVNLKDKDCNVILDIVPFNLENVEEVHLEFVNKIQPKLSSSQEIPIFTESKNYQDQHFDQQPSVINPAAPNATNIIYSDDYNDTIKSSPTDLFDKATIDAKSTSKLMHMGRPIPMYYGMPMTCCIPMICGMGSYGMGSYGMGSYGMGSYGMGLDPLKLTKVQDIKDNKKIVELSGKIKKLESEFKNHHHDIPTSGVRNFDNDEHPYFKKP